MLEKNLQSVEKRVLEACTRANRDRSEVTLIAVSKTKPIPMLEEIYNCGIRDFGENKVQELTEKESTMAKDINWHMIGHLQKNKVKYIASTVTCIHSVDSMGLLEVIEKEGRKSNRIIEVLLEVNVAEEETKFGLKLEEVHGILEQVSGFNFIKIVGLMTIAPYVENPEENRTYFKQLRNLFVDIRGKNYDNVNMSEISMGMSNDFEVAIEEGATMVRVGTGIFGERNYSL